jgi:hypothetical protein
LKLTRWVADFNECRSVERQEEEVGEADTGGEVVKRVFKSKNESKDVEVVGPYGTNFSPTGSLGSDERNSETSMEGRVCSRGREAPRAD